MIQSRQSRMNSLDIIYNYQTWLAYEELFFTPLPAVVSGSVGDPSAG